MVEELVKLPTTTRIIARAAIIEASKRPEQYRAGLIVHLVRSPQKIAQKNISAATRQLTRPAATSPGEVDRQREDQVLSALSEPELLALVDRVLEKAPAGTLRDSLVKQKDKARTSGIWRHYLLSELATVGGGA